MSLLSKLFSGQKPTLSDVVDLLQGKDQKPTARPGAAQSDASSYAPAYQVELGEETPVGRSWGQRMPNEPNQYNYPGSYTEYFEDIFNREFSDLRYYRQQNPYSAKTSSYVFCRGTQKVLTLELVAQGCDVYQLRRACEREGTPYLRFYYNHEGWWNARSYVVRRMREAING